MTTSLPSPARAPWIGDAEARDRLARIGQRVVVAALIAAHGWGRWAAGAVPPFGAFLEGQGLPFGLALAVAITGLEILGTVLLALGRLVRPLVVVFAAVYATGIVLVHAPAGWFVVGLGRNGAEYSVLLIACLLCVGLQHRARTESGRGPA